MCGFAGIVTKSSSPSIVNEQNLLKMSEAIKNRGPDDLGFWINPNVSLGLVHTRLAIVDLSVAGHQPMNSESGRWTIAFNGEIYNHNEIRRKVESIKPRFWNGYSDTETLLVAIEVFGFEETLSMIVGMFAFALWDEFNQELYLVRDRLGEKPLYYTNQEEYVVFGSELTTIESLFDKNKFTVDRSSLSQLIRQGYITSPNTIYKEVKKMEPGTYLKVSQAIIEKSCYWSAQQVLAKGETSYDSHEKVLNELDNLLRQSVSEQMISDVPLGAFLSGGIDSSTIVAIMQSLCKDKVRTFSIGFHDELHDEAVFASKIAEHLATDHKELYVSEEELLSAVYSLPDIYSEPFADSSQLPMYLVCKMAKKHVTVCLSGDGGDELFLGYDRYQKTINIWSLITKLPHSARKFLANSSSLLPINMLNMFSDNKLLGDKIAKALDVVDETDFLRFYRSFMMSNYRDIDNLVKGGDDGISNLPLDCFELMDKESLMSLLDLQTYLPDDILCKVDRAAMAVSLESRIPLLDHRIVEFALRLPKKFKSVNGVTKYPLKSLLYRYVPKELVDRPKKGFSVPLGDWLRSELKEWAEALINREQLEADGYFNSDTVHLLWSEHQLGTRNWAQVLWSILMFQAWLERRR